MAKRLNYDEFTVNFENALEGQALFNYYSILIDFLVEKFGKDPVRIALEELIKTENSVVTSLEKYRSNV